MSRAAILLFYLSTSAAPGQYDIGVSLGVKTISWVGADFEHAQKGEPAVSILYRERCSERVNFGMELQWSRWEFYARYGIGSQAYRIGTHGDVVLHLLHFGLTPEIALDPKRSTVLRIGPQFGAVINSSMSGTRYDHSYYSQSFLNEEFHHEKARDFGGDFRFLLGIGVRFPWKNIALWVDPYAAVGINALLKEEPRARANEFGIRIGLARKSERDCVTRWIDQHLSERSASTGD